MSKRSQNPPPDSPIAAEAPTLPRKDELLKSRTDTAQADPQALREELRDTQERLGFVLESIQDYALMLLDVNGTVTGWSAGAEKILGFSEKEIIGQKVHKIFTPEDIAAQIPEHEMSLSQTEGRATDDRWHMRKDGSRFWATGFMRPLFLLDKNKQLRGFAKLVRDLTASKHAEDQVKQANESLETRVKERTAELTHMQSALHQAEKLEAIGRLAGGVAHDFNNLMTGISGMAEDLQDKLGAESPHRGDLDDIMNASRKATAITKQLLAFGRRQVVSPQVLNLNQVIGSMEGLFRRLLGEDIEIKINLDAQLGYVYVDPGNIEQVILNLGLNSRDAMVAGGTLTLETANAELGEDHVKRRFDVKPGSYVVLSVSDTGCGMSEETIAHMFEPFFTTKGTKGTGLGLANVYGIIKSADGDIAVESRPGKGSVFRIYLPQVPASRASEGPVVDPHEVPGGPETILVTEDEDIVRKVVVRALRKKGYQVFHATTAPEAITISSKLTEPIDLLLTDVVMPGMNGQELAKAIAPKHPSMAVIYMSGYSQELIDQRGVLQSGAEFIQKSFSADLLCRKVRDVLDAVKKTAPAGNMKRGAI